jgi:hypothetical protein
MNGDNLVPVIDRNRRIDSGVVPVSPVRKGGTGQNNAKCLHAKISDIIAYWLLLDSTLTPFKGSCFNIVPADELIDRFA